MAILAFGAMSFAQADLTTSGSARGTFWDSADTVIQSETKEIDIRIAGKSVMDLMFQLKTNKVSGTVTHNIYFQGSNDGTTYTNLDTIVHTNVETQTDFLNLDDFNYSYLKITFTNSGASQKAWYQCWYSFREE